MNCTEIDDGRNDCILTINGVKAVIITQEFIEQCGITQEMARDVAKGISELFVLLAEKGIEE
jgi:hypothetical protein